MKILATTHLKRESQSEKAPDMKPWAEMGMKYGWLSMFIVRFNDLCNVIQYFFIFVVITAASTVIIPMGQEMMENQQKG